MREPVVSANTCRKPRLSGAAMLDSVTMATPQLAPVRPRAVHEGAVRISWGSLLLALIIMGICLFSGLESVGLTGPDEPRYASIAREMVRTGDWVTPRLGDEPWLEKPVLYYWAAAAAMRCFGEGEFAARLPSAMAASMATLFMAWAALRNYGLDAARLTLFMLPATVALIGFGKAAAPDMIFSASLASAAVPAAEMLQRRRPGALARLLFGALLGAAALAKGPVALLLAIGAVILWALLSRQPAAPFRFLHPACLAAFALVAVPWYVLCAARNPQFLRIFFLEHNFQRFLTPVFEHDQPFWFFGPVLLAGVFPWTVLVVPWCLDVLRRRSGGEWRDSPLLFFACWAIAPVLFFSLSQSKLPGYILPSVPPAVLVLAVVVARLHAEKGGSARVWVALVGCTFALMTLTAGYWLRLLPEQSGMSDSGAWSGLLIFAALGGLLCTLLAWTRREQAAISGIAALVALLIVAASLGPLPRLDPYISARQVARLTLEETRGSEPVTFLGIGRSLRYGLDFYLGRPLPEWTPEQVRPVWIWITPGWAAELERRGLRYDVRQKISGEAWLVRLGEPGV
jgi:4-amino-4-deoxy-L-arabinose transferase-like glycosyltransferase